MMSYGITDRLRFTIIKVNTNEIIVRDLVVLEPEVIVNLSSPSRCSFKIPQSEQYESSNGINWKSWGYWIVPEIEINGVRKCLGAQLVNKVTIDSKAGMLMVEGIGFMGYPKGIPWLEDYNPIAPDVGEVVQQIWQHIQNFQNANLNVNVLPALLDVVMTPGYSFENGVLNFDFTAMWVRQTDFQDCGDVITTLARDIPFDMLEEVTWNSSRGALNKILRLGYPSLGSVQSNLSFVYGENVITAELKEETDIEPVSDVIIRGWRPGKVYSEQLNIETVNAELVAAGKPQIIADPLERVRRVIMEEDANIDSTERAQAWAKRRLTRRNIPHSFSKITIDPNHPNAPLDSFWLADTISVKAKDYPWIGDISYNHRITSITFKDNEPTVELGLMVEGAFNYDPIEYTPYSPTNPTVDTNLLSNGYFTSNTAGWRIISGEWIRFSTEGYSNAGCMRVLTNDAAGEFYESHKISVNPGGQYKLSAWVKRESVTKRSDFNASAGDGIYIGMKHYKNGGVVGNTIFKLDSLPYPEGTGAWTKLESLITVPSGDTVNEISILLCAKGFSGGNTWWDDVRVVKQ